MQVDWTWRLAGMTLVVVTFCSLAAFGAARIMLDIGIDPDIAGIACLGVWIANFFLIEPIKDPIIR